ncbi:MAG TPA: serine/threonine protein kinase, partial [Bacteroidales bacterium]|nr:serine/threonine protein kinase [Bacteroidales bacterium]
MICSRLLNEAVNEKGIYEPNEILEEVDKNIRIALKQDQDKNSDGMDICLICIENENQNLRLKFCGAKRPLFYFSNQTAELVELKADRRSIGGSGSLKNKVNFTTQEITVSSNDVIYLSTDGYTDQNNNLRKRLGTAKLTRIFKELGNKPLQEQK